LFQAKLYLEVLILPTGGQPIVVVGGGGAGRADSTTNMQQASQSRPTSHALGIIPARWYLANPMEMNKSGSLGARRRQTFARTITRAASVGHKVLFVTKKNRISQRQKQKGHSTLTNTENGKAQGRERAR
jgi:hypothetical protein